MQGLTFGLTLLSVTALFACSEAQPTDGGGGGAGGTGDGGSSSEDGGAPGSGGNGGSPGAGGSTSSSMGTGEVVVNEIDANDDWVELYNPGANPFDLGGLTLADSDGAGGPKLDEAIVFPAGTTLAAGAHLFILAKQDAVVSPGEQEPQTACAPGASPCFYAPFGLSDADGDEIFLLAGDELIASSVYPPAAAMEGETWCQVPDGSGDFAVCAPTPSADNESL